MVRQATSSSYYQKNSLEHYKNMQPGHLIGKKDKLGQWNGII